MDYLLEMLVESVMLTMFVSMMDFSMEMTPGVRKLILDRVLELAVDGGKLLKLELSFDVGNVSTDQALKLWITVVCRHLWIGELV